MVPFDPCEPKITLHHENPTKADLKTATGSSNRLTIFDSPVILDSSIAREWPDIRTPSAGTWR
jgi:hypothetical protein